MEKHHEQIIKVFRNKFIRINKYLFKQVKWSPDNFYHNIEDPYSLKLASADSVGNILIWDVYKSSVQSEFRDGNKSISGFYK